MAQDKNPPTLPIPEDKKERFEKIKAKFIEIYGEEPKLFSRAPGRVNLIGEHIDYCGYSVLPMAVELDIVMAVSPDTQGQISLVNTDPQYQSYNVDVNQIVITKDVPHWYKYVLCGIQGIIEHFQSDTLRGFKAVVDGTVPRSAGLSSSSALVCCSALSMLKANEWTMSKEQLAEDCFVRGREFRLVCQGQRVQTALSGAESSDCFLFKWGTNVCLLQAKLIEFNPLLTQDVLLPPNAAFVVGNSLAEMNKAATPQFNTRVVECRLAAQVLATSQEGVKWREIRRLGELQEKLGYTLDEMLNLVTSKLHPEPYTKQEVCEILEVTPEELVETSLSANTTHVESFSLYNRATHVYSEAKRVVQFKAICDQQPGNALEQLGELMNQSHASCRDMYDCSHPDLDTLVEVSKANGAVGSRMTGAGWGGCTVSIVNAEKVSSLLAGVKASYYQPNPDKFSKVDEALFATTPGGGAAFYIA
uniref:Galactokinase n=1 Tax=Biomphalaria glabrata TaxID=6526 RepID=A0A2C9JRK1_BIOGL